MDEAAAQHDAVERGALAQRQRRFENYFAREESWRSRSGTRSLLKPVAVVPKLCELLGVPFDAAVLAPRGERAHILRGNRMRFDPSVDRR